jgi:hypothetical protein
MKRSAGYLIAIVGLMLSITYIVLVITGCLDDGKMEYVLIKSSARIAGYKVATDNPGLAAVAAPQAQALLAAAGSAEPVMFTDVLFPAAVQLLLRQVDDPLLVATIMDATSLIEPEAPVSMRQAQIRAALQGFLEGLTLAPPAGR